MTFCCDKYDNIQRKAFNNINEMDNIKFKIRNKTENLKLFFAKTSLNPLIYLDSF